MTASKTLSTRPRKIADLETVFGTHWRKLWNHIKAETGSSIRCPKSVNVYADPRPLCVNDHHLCRRFAWDMSTGELSAGAHVSTGEWAVHAGPNNDGAVAGLPRNVAIITVEWTDYHRYMALDVQVHPEALPASLPA